MIFKVKDLIKISSFELNLSGETFTFKITTHVGHGKGKINNLRKARNFQNEIKILNIK